MNAHTSPLAEVAKLESARYALIRRLGFVFRHHLVVNLQPLNMVCQVLHHRLGAAAPDVPALHDGVDQISRLVRTSIDSCSDVVSWITADPLSTIAVEAGVAECLANVRSSFSFRGFSVQCEESNLGSQVTRVAIREVLTSALLATTDHAKGLDDIRVSVKSAAPAVEITIQLRRGSNTSNAEHDAYRLIEWDEVQTLAAFHGAQISRSGDALVTIRLQQSLEAPAQ